MAGALRKTMIYLGLAEGDENYQVPAEKYEQTPSKVELNNEDRSADYGERFNEVSASQYAVATLRNEDYRAPVTPIKKAAAGREESGGLKQITTVHPRSYNDAKLIGESFRDGIPVIMNVTDMGEADAKRLVDFSAGLVFGMHGTIERVTNKVFLLSPSFVEILGEDKKVSDTPTAFFNQS